MKKILCFAVAIMAILLVSCTADTEKTPTVTKTDYSIENTLTALTESAIFHESSIIYRNGSDRELDEDYLDYYFGRNDILDGVDSYAFITSPTTNVCEAGIFKVTDAKNVEVLKEAFATRRDNLIQTHTNYSADDLAISENMIIASFDDVVYFIATADNTAAEEIIKG